MREEFTVYKVNLQQNTKETQQLISSGYIGIKIPSNSATPEKLNRDSVSWQYSIWESAEDYFSKKIPIPPQTERMNKLFERSR